MIAASSVISLSNNLLRIKSCAKWKEKSEIRISKYWTNSNAKIPNPDPRATNEFLGQGLARNRFDIWTSVF